MAPAPFRRTEVPTRATGPRASRGTPPGRPAASAATKRFIGGWRTISSSSSSENSRAPRITGSCDLDVLERAVSRGRRRRSTWTTWRSPGVQSGAIDSATAIGPSSCSASHEAELLAELAVQRLLERLAALDAAARAAASTPCPASPGGRAARGRASAGAARRGRAARRPSVPRRAEAAHAPLRLGQLVDLDRLDLGHRHDHELGDPHARLDDERLARVGVQQRDAQLAAVARVDEARRVHDRDAVLRREARARLDEARVARRGSRRRARCRRARARPAPARRARTPRGRGPRRPRTRASARPRRVAAAGSAARSRRLPLRGARAHEEARVPREVAPRQARDDEHAVRRCPRAARSARRARRAPTARRRRRTGRAAARAPSGSRTARPAAPSAPRAPRRSPRETCGASGKRLPSRRRPISSTQVDLVQHELHGQLVGADLLQHVLDRRAPSRSSSSSSAEPSATCSTTSATSVSSSVAANPSTS